MGELHKSPTGLDSIYVAVGTACLTLSLLGGAHTLGKALEASSSQGPASLEARNEAAMVGSESLVALSGSMLMYLLSADRQRQEDDKA